LVNGPVVFKQISNKTIFLNSQGNYQYYAYSIRKISPGQTAASVNRIIYYDKQF
jgi:hypothetical protein